MAQFKRGDFSTCGAPRPGRLKTVTTTENIDKIHELILEDHWISAKSIAEQLGISRRWVGSGPSFMKIWTCGSSTRSGCRNAWTRIKNFNGASLLSKFGFFLVRSKWFPVGRDWWPWTKPGYITMTRTQNNNQWSGDIAAHLAPKNSECKNPLEKFSPRFFWDQEGILLIYYLSTGQTINAEYYWSLLVKVKDILKEKLGGKVTKGVLLLHVNAPAHRALATQKKLAYLGFQCLDHPPYSPDLSPSDYHLFSGLKNNWTVAIFVRRGGHCYHGDLVGRTNFWFFFSGLQKLEERAKKYIELRGEYVE